jgi:hypothetical protein
MARMLSTVVVSALLLGAFAGSAGAKLTRVIDRAWTLAGDGERYVVYRPYPIGPELGVIDSKRRRTHVIDTRIPCATDRPPIYGLYGTVAAGRVLLPCTPTGEPLVLDLATRTPVAIPAVTPPAGLRPTDVYWHALGRSWVGGRCYDGSCQAFRNLRTGRWVLTAPTIAEPYDDSGFDLDSSDGRAWRPCRPWRPGIDGLRYGDHVSDGRWVTWWTDSRGPGHVVRIARCGGRSRTSLGYAVVDVENAVPSYSAGWLTWEWRGPHAYQPSTGRRLHWQYPLKDAEGQRWGDVLHTRYAAYLASVVLDLSDHTDFLVYGVHEARLPR